jgi:putative heme iron utilization protein
VNVVDVYYVGGFGVMGCVPASEYYGASPDPLADSAMGIIQHMNADHAATLIVLAKTFAGVDAQEAAVTSVDRLGFNVSLKTEDGTHGGRIAFLREVSNPAAVRDVLAEMPERARLV